MTVIDVLRGPGSPKQEKILRDTWGHNAPEPRRRYWAKVTLAYGETSGLNLLAYETKGLAGNPWTHEHFATWFHKEAQNPRYAIGSKIGVWVWRGTYMVAKNGNPKFSGKSRPMRLIERLPPGKIIRESCPLEGRLTT